MFFKKKSVKRIKVTEPRQPVVSRYSVLCPDLYICQDTVPSPLALPGATTKQTNNSLGARRRMYHLLTHCPCYPEPTLRPRRRRR